MDDVTPPLPEAQAFLPTTATSIDELTHAAFFVAASIDPAVVEVVSPHQVNLHYPADGSLVSIRIEGRPGAWGGISPHGTPEEEAAKNQRYDDSLAASVPPVEPPPPAPPPQESPNPVYEVQRQS